jgi:hypothetical protein
MNCQPGDMALVIGPDGDPDVGRMVTCIRLYRVDEVYWHDNRRYRAGIDFWVVDRELHWRKDGVLRMLPFCPDQHLVPIRPERDRDLERVQVAADAMAKARAAGASSIERLYRWAEQVTR